MSKIQNVTDENFESTVIGSEKVFVLDFFSEWCPPCKMMAPVFDEIADELADSASFGKMDISANSQTPSNRSVLAVPTFVIFKGGEEIKRLTGVTPKAKFKAEIEKAL